MPPKRKKPEVKSAKGRSQKSTKKVSVASSSTDTADTEMVAASSISAKQTQNDAQDSPMSVMTGSPSTGTAQPEIDQSSVGHVKGQGKRPRSSVQKEPEVTAKKRKAVTNKGPDQLQRPLSDLRGIIRSSLDAAQKYGLQHYVDSNRQFYIKVGTLCSGTDAPLHVMKLFGMLKNHEGKQVFTAINTFACEIEPFKQAFLLRNSKPQLLFRDAVDFTVAGAKTARLVSGTEADVPEVDLFVAGTSCVDFSKLNSAKQDDFQGLKEANQRFEEKLKKVDGQRTLTKKDCDIEDWRECIGGLLNQKGGHRQSSSTFAGAMNYIFERQPKIVIFENVEGAPWESTLSYVFPLCGYAPVIARMDTKNYYLPQTRLRKYLIAFNQTFFGIEGAAMLSSAFKDVAEKLEHRYSSSITDFLLPVHSLELHRARNEMELAASSTKEKESDWKLSRVRHAAFRRENDIPDERPWIQWSDHGSSNAPAKMWKPWEARQTNRVSDLLECVYLLATQGKNSKHSKYDPRFKAQIIDCSQNVDRVNVTTPFGATGCLTPSAIPVLTLDARPVTGSESLRLQGLPIENFDMSSETQAQMQDLAGNAMTTTVVGAAILATLCCVANYSKDYNLDWLETCFEKRDYEDTETWDRNSFHISDTSLDMGQHEELKVVLFDCLKPDGGVAEILTLGERTRRRCECYHILAYSSMELYVCSICDAWLCKSCKGNPQHRMEKAADDLDQIRSLPYATAETNLRKFFPSVLPMIAAIDLGEIDGLRKKLFAEGYGAASSSILADAIVAGLTNTTYELSFIEVTDATRIEYVAKGSFFLRIIIEQHKLTWYLYADPWSEVGTQLFASHKPGDQAIARAVLGPQAASQFPEEWEFWLPVQTDFDISFRCGTRRTLQITAITEVQESRIDTQSINETLQGREWVYHPECGFPEDALWVSQEEGEKLFMFKDVDPIGAADKDAFVITDTSREMGRSPLAESRAVLIRIQCESQIHELIQELETLNGSAEGHEVTLKAFTSGRWVSHAEHLVNIPPFTNDVNLQALEKFPAQFPADYRLPSCGFQVPATVHSPNDDCFACQRDQIFLKMSLPIFGKSPEAVDATLEIFRGLDLTQQLDLAEFCRLIEPGFFAVEKQIMQLEQACVGGGRMLFAREIITEDCRCCAPKIPTVMYKKSIARTGMKIAATHSLMERMDYEKNVRSKPMVLRIDHNVDPSLVVHPKKKDDISYVDIRIIGRCHTLMQEARSRLSEHPAFHYEFPVTHVTFALEFGVLENPRPALAAIAIQAPKSLKELGHVVQQPAGFRLGMGLFEEQLASLNWMMSRENDDINLSFTEREFAEVYVHNLRLRAVAQATRDITRRGRVVADAVGFGKTLVSLALIDRQREMDRGKFLDLRKSNPHLRGMLHLSATLVIVPHHLTGQWLSESKRFLTPDHDVLVLKTFSQLRNMDVAYLKRADIIICSNKIFQEKEYGNELSRYCDRKDLDLGSVPRAYRAWYQRLHKLLQDTRDLALKTRGVSTESDSVAGGSFSDHISALKARLLSLRDESSPFNPPTGFKAGWKPVLLLEFFSFSRVIWDEFPYENVQVAEFVANVATISKWMLSGTPPLTTLGDICKIAYLFNVDLAKPLALVSGRQPTVCEHDPMQPLSTLEQANLYQSRHSSRLLQERHQQALDFVAKFMRKNTRAMAEIKSFQTPVVLSQGMTSLVVYNNLQQELTSRTFDGNAAASDTRRRLMSLCDWKDKSKLGTQRSMEALTLRASSSLNDVLVRQFGENASLESASTIDVIETFYNDGLQDIKSLEDAGRELFGMALHLAYRDVYILLRDHQNALDSQEPRHFHCYQDLEKIMNDILNLNLTAYCGWDALESALRILIWDDQFLETIGHEVDVLDQATLASQVKRTWNAMRFGVTPAGAPTLRSTQMGRASSIAKKRSYLNAFSKLQTKSPLHTRRWFSVEDLGARAPPYLLSLLRMEWEHKVPWEQHFRSAVGGETAQALVPIRKLQQPSSAQAIPFDLQKLKDLDAIRSGDSAKVKGEARERVKAELERRLGKKISNPTKPQLLGECIRRGLACKDTATPRALWDLIIEDEGGPAGGDLHRSSEGRYPTVKNLPAEGRRTIRGGSMEPCFDELMATIGKLRTVLERLVMVHAKKNLHGVLLKVCQMQTGKEWKCRDPGCTAPAGTHWVSLDCGHIHCPLPGGAGLETATCEVRGCTRSMAGVCVTLGKLMSPSRQAIAAEFGGDPLSKDPGSYSVADTDVTGPKAKFVTALIHAIPAQDQVVVFVQNKKIMDDAYTALRGAGISHVLARDLDHDESAALEGFKAGKKRVLVQVINSEQAAGSNLHNANHVIFMSPLITRKQRDWDAQMQQALGRCIRFRQEKTVYVYHLTMDETIEVDTLEWRMKKEILVGAGKAVGRFNDCSSADFLDHFDAKVPRVTRTEGRAISLVPRQDIQMLMGDDYVSVTKARTSRTIESAEAAAAKKLDVDDGEGGGIVTSAE